ncbi:MAG TPA: polyprenyl synthetase family protein [Campylobacterales bacterium]|nr:polyprenyl synthetase family protein [Campylobacterales bacterium]
MTSKKLLQDFEAYLNANLPTAHSFHPHFQAAQIQMFKAGGKRFRPLLLLNVVDSYEPQLVENSMRVALAIEMLHTYSLIHDDLPTFDDAPLRRGSETLHQTYGEVTATLVGDALNTDSFTMIATCALRDDVKIALIKAFSLNAGGEGMVLGQAIDCFFEDKKLTLDELTFLHIHKTAKLIAASLQMGAIIVNLPKEKETLLYEIGLKIGLLFQVQDDIIDATQTAQEAGKPTSNDEAKNSFTNLLGVEGANKEKQRIIEEIYTDFVKLDDSLKNRLTIMIEKYFN